MPTIAHEHRMTAFSNANGRASTIAIEDGENSAAGRAQYLN